MTSSNGNIFRVIGSLWTKSTGHQWIPLVTNGFPSQRPVTRSFDVFFDTSPNKWLSKQSRRQWFETPLRSLWHHCNGLPGNSISNTDQLNYKISRISLLLRTWLAWMNYQVYMVVISHPCPNFWQGEGMDVVTSHRTQCVITYSCHNINQSLVIPTHLETACYYTVCHQDHCVIGITHSKMYVMNIYQNFCGREKYVCTSIHAFVIITFFIQWNWQHLNLALK